MALTHRRPRVGIELSENYKTALTSQFLISVFDHSDDRGLGHGQRQGPKVIKRAAKITSIVINSKVAAKKAYIPVFV